MNYCATTKPRWRTFSADASQQLRTPLAALRLELEIAALGSRDGQPELTTALDQVGPPAGHDRDVARSGPWLAHGERITDLKPAVSDLEARWHGPLAQDGRPLYAVTDLEEAVAAISPAVLAQIGDVLVQNAQVHGRGAVDVAVHRVGGAPRL
jgi:signal transduction histidine kinase